VEILQANIAEKQRLRREASLYRYLDAERERIEQKRIDDARLLEQAQEALKAQAQAEAEARRKAELEKQEKLEKENPANDNTKDDAPLDLSPDVLNQ
jgi:uncharacterized protein YdaU (DUF1376 family)